MTHSPQDMLSSVLTDKVMKEIDQLACTAFDTTINKWLPEEHLGKGVFFRAGFFIQSPQGFVPYEFISMWLGGEKNRENEIMYRGQSAEKIWRLLQQFMLNGHISAAQSKVEGKNFKGAICFKVHLGDDLHWIEDVMWLAASGIPDDGDEAGLVETARLIGERIFKLVEFDELDQILTLGKNGIFKGKV